MEPAQDLTLEGLGDEDYLTEDDLPAGIFPEAHPESCRQALKKAGIACTRLNAELFYEMNQLGRNRLMGCSTDELREIDLWDLCSETNIWEEPDSGWNGKLLTPKDQQDNHNRQTRWEHVEHFLQGVHLWCSQQRAPELVTGINRLGLPIWRFRRLRWTADGISPADSAAGHLPAKPREILQAAWNFLFRCRRRWLKAHPGQVWLSEPCLHLIRGAFRALFRRLNVPETDWPHIHEDPKPTWPNKLEARLSELQDREVRAIRRLCYLEHQGQLQGEKLRRALDFLDGLAEDLAVTQRRLDEVIVRLAQKQGSGAEVLGPRLDLAYLSPEDLVELKEAVLALLSAGREPQEEEVCDPVMLFPTYPLSPDLPAIHPQL